MMNAHIITIGDELLIGQVINTNQASIADRLNEIGIDVTEMTTVGDDTEAILAAFTRAWESARAVIVTGGLGPTHDDITKSAVCRFFRTDLIPDANVRKQVALILKQRNFPWTDAAEAQAMVPRLATAFPNPVGTAPGLRFDGENRWFFVLPGVPFEMKEMVDAWIVPFLRQHAGENVIRHRTLRTTGIAESLLAQQLGDIDQILQGARLAFLPSTMGLRLRITVHARTAGEADRIVAGVEERIRAKASTFIYGTGEEELEEVVGRMLTERKMTLAVAESCTGGFIAHRLTNVSGSSAYFTYGAVTYSNESKMNILDVPSSVLGAHGAVSRETAEAMAAGIRKRAGTDIGLATTGIAGPTGGSPEKPVGLVWIACADAAGIVGVKFMFGEGRLRVKERASQSALALVRRRLLGIE